MDLTKPGELKRLLEANGLHLSKRFGQHFLTSRPHLEKVVEAANVGPDDHIFEIGPGVGTLTLELAQRGAAKVVSVELDRGILPVLTANVAPYPNITVVQADALKLDLPAFLDEQWGSGVTG